MDRYPALYYGLALLSGVALAYGIWPTLFLILFGQSRINKIGFALIASFALIETLYFMPILPPGKVSGHGYCQISKVRVSDNSLGYFGNLSCFITEDKTYYDIPVKFFRNKLLDDSTDYLVRGSLRKNPAGPYTLFPSIIEAVPYTNNLCQLRFKLKEKFRAYISTHLKDEMCAAFFSSLGTGEIENRLLGLQFNKAGLTHTLAISGFHYTWLVFIMGSFFHLFLSKRKTCYFLLIIVSLYFLFIGETPSLNRAWLAALIYLVGYLIKEPVSGLNSLGVALMISLILDPLVLKEIGFQLSYLATFAILAIYPTIEIWLRKFFPKRQTFKLGFLLSSFCRNTFAITIAVNLATAPLLLYHFNYFPYLSLFFNLFFPIAITPCMIALILSPIPLIGPPILKLTEIYTTPLLSTIFYGVDLIEGGLWSSQIPFDLLAALLILVLIIGLWLEQRKYALYHLEGV